MSNKKLARRKRCDQRFGRGAVLAFVLGCASPFAAAQSLPAQMVINSPSLVQMIDGKDRGNEVSIGILAPRLWSEGYDFGYMQGQAFHSLLGHGRWGSAEFAGGTLIDFALRKRSDDDGSNGSDSQYYRLSDSADYALQHYFVPINERNSRNPVVMGTYYHDLTLFWDPDKDNDRDLMVKLFTRSRFDGMNSAPLAPVPVPSAVWLLGSGLFVLTMLGIWAGRRPQKSCT